MKKNILCMVLVLIGFSVGAMEQHREVTRALANSEEQRRKMKVRQLQKEAARQTVARFGTPLQNVTPAPLTLAPYAPRPTVTELPTVDAEQGGEIMDYDPSSQLTEDIDNISTWCGACAGACCGACAACIMGSIYKAFGGENSEYLLNLTKICVGLGGATGVSIANRINENDEQDLNCGRLNCEYYKCRQRQGYAVPEE